MKERVTVLRAPGPTRRASWRTSRLYDFTSTRAAALAGRDTTTLVTPRERATRLLRLERIVLMQAWSA